MEHDAIAGGHAVDLALVRDLAIGGLETRTLDPDTPAAFLLPDGYRVEHAPDLEKWLPVPRRKRGVAEPATVEAFMGYVARHRTPATTVWVHPTDGSLVAILDDHEAELGAGNDPSQAGHGQHRAELDLKQTPEWKFWIGKDGHTFSQESFTEHIEDGVKEIVTPEPAAMLEIASTFHAKGELTFSKVTNLQNGNAQLGYNEQANATAGEAGEMEIPREIELAVAPFIGGPRYKLIARFRYRIRGGALTLTYRLDRPHDVVRDALQKVAEDVEAAFPGVVFIGEPRS